MSDVVNGDNRKDERIDQSFSEGEGEGKTAAKEEIICSWKVKWYFSPTLRFTLNLNQK